MDAIRSQLAARIAELEGQRDQLREALLALRDDGAWINDAWIVSADAYDKADAALKATEEG